jgi:hypothetical protein
VAVVLVLVMGLAARLVAVVVTAVALLIGVAA